jgi:hypothetical protein
MSSALALINTTPVVLFIPRLLPNVSKECICDYFKTNKIGVVTNINAKYRVNEKNHEYWFAFVSVKFFDTFCGKRMYQKIIEKEKTAYMYYDEMQGKYWEISIRAQDRKKHMNVNVATEPDIPVTPTTRSPTPRPRPTKNMALLEEGEIEEEYPLIMNTHFTIPDHIEMYHDYREIEKEIYGNNAFSWSNNNYVTKWETFIPLRI